MIIVVCRASGGVTKSLIGDGRSGVRLRGGIGNGVQSLTVFTKCFQRISRQVGQRYPISKIGGELPAICRDRMIADVWQSRQRGVREPSPTHIAAARQNATTKPYHNSSTASSKMLFQRHQPPDRFVQMTEDLIGGSVNLNDVPDSCTAGHEGFGVFRLHGRERLLDGLFRAIRPVFTVQWPSPSGQCRLHSLLRGGYTTGYR
jgi:hypothetical protein